MPLIYIVGLEGKTRTKNIKEASVAALKLVS